MITFAAKTCSTIFADKLEVLVRIFFAKVFNLKTMMVKRKMYAERIPIASSQGTVGPGVFSRKFLRKKVSILASLVLSVTVFASGLVGI